MILRERLQFFETQQKESRPYSKLIVPKSDWIGAISPESQAEKALCLVNKAALEALGVTGGILHIFGRNLEGLHGEYKGTQFLTADLNIDRLRDNSSTIKTVRTWLLMRLAQARELMDPNLLDSIPYELDQVAANRLDLVFRR